MKIAIWLIMCTSLVCSCTKSTHIVLTNNRSFARIDEPIIITRQFLDSIFHKNISRYFPLILNQAGDTIPSQTDDLDGDKKWDELFLLVDFSPFERKNIQLVLLDTAHRPKFTQRANLRFAKVVEKGKVYAPISDAQRLTSNLTELSQAAFQMEGPAWESDRVAFRNYYDARNGIDIYGKVTSRMILDSVGTGENYHNLQWWGMDILHVGNSLGAGAIGIQDRDTLYRLDLPESGRFEAVSRGPLRVIFRLKYNNWNVAGKQINLVHEISTWGGFYGYQSKIEITGSSGNETLVSGIVNIHSDTLFTDNSISTYSAIYTYANQAENGKGLGMGMILSNKDYAGHGKAPDTGSGISQSFLARLYISNRKPVKFRFYAGWENSNPAFKTAVLFGKFIARETERISEPILLSIR